MRKIEVFLGDLGTKFYIRLDQDPGYVNLNNVHMTYSNDKCDRIGGVITLTSLVFHFLVCCSFPFSRSSESNFFANISRCE
jgi:hypothetical protein